MTEAEANESPGDEKDERSNYLDEELPELANSEVAPEELRAEPDQESEDETIEDVYLYLLNSWKARGVPRLGFRHLHGRPTCSSTGTLGPLRGRCRKA